MKRFVVLGVILTIIIGITCSLKDINSKVKNDHDTNNIIADNREDGKNVSYGSKFTYKEFTEPKYLIGRPLPGSPTSLEGLNEEEKATIKKRIDFLHRLDPKNNASIPLDLIVNSGNGYDAYISEDAAEYQISRIASIRNISKDKVKSIIKKHTQGKNEGIKGEPRVDVYMVNLDLDSKA